MDLGQFSISLAVKDLGASRRFYETMGFRRLDGDGERWLLLANGDAKIGLFQQMFDDNLITLNPPDARALEQALKDAGYTIDKPTEGAEGPTHFALRDPDGNTLLVDQLEPAAPSLPEGRVGWVDLTVPDADALSDFYAAVLDVETAPVDMGGYSDFCLVDATGKASAGVCHARGPNDDLPPVWLVYFVVRDLDACMDRVVKGGGSIVRAPRGEQGESEASRKSRFCVIKDPRGVCCALYQAL